MALPTRPSVDALWATSPGVDGNGNSLLGNPGGTKQILGWIIEKPAVQFWNWFWNLLYQWQIYGDRRQETSNMVLNSASGAYSIPLGKSIWIMADCTAGNQTYTLPTPVTVVDDGMRIKITRKDATGNTLTWTGTISGETNPTIPNQYTSEAVIAYGGLWFWE